MSYGFKVAGKEVLQYCCNNFAVLQSKNIRGRSK